MVAEITTLDLEGVKVSADPTRNNEFEDENVKRRAVIVVSYTPINEKCTVRNAVGDIFSEVNVPDYFADKHRIKVGSCLIVAKQYNGPEYVEEVY